MRYMVATDFRCFIIQYSLELGFGIGFSIWYLVYGFSLILEYGFNTQYISFLANDWKICYKNAEQGRDPVENLSSVKIPT